MEAKLIKMAPFFVEVSFRSHFVLGFGGGVRWLHILAKGRVRLKLFKPTRAIKSFP